MEEFVNRDKELKVLKSKLISDNFELIIIYGRRRIGKTKLVLRSLSEIKGGAYYFSTYSNNMKRFKEEFSLQYLADDWVHLLNAFKNRILVIDEFPYLAKEYPEIMSILQKLIDIEWKNTKTKIVLIGSSISMMEELTLTGKSPLYGRATLRMELKEIPFLEVAKYFIHKGYPMEEIVKIYGFSGGMPYYFMKLKNTNLEEYIEKEVKDEYSYIHDEVLFLIKEEFHEPRKYLSILHAVAKGKGTRKEIKDITGMKNEDISPYLENLIRVDFIRIKEPLLLKNSKLRRYAISNNFIRFWFLFIYPYKTKIEQKMYSFKKMRKEYNDYLGSVFEDIAGQFLKNLYPSFYFGSYWDRKGKVEIDIIAINEQTKEMLALEVKWQDIKLRDAKKIIEELHEKLPYVEWHNEERKEVLGIFAKSIDKKAREWLESNGYKGWDLRDVEKVMG